MSGTSLFLNQNIIHLDVLSFEDNFISKNGIDLFKREFGGLN